MKKVFLMVGIAAIFMACNQSSSNAGEEQEVAEASSESVAYTVSTDASTVQWFGEKITGWSHKGLVSLQSGTLNVMDNKIVSGNFTIDMNTITEIESVMDEAKQTKLVGHLKSPDFFNVDSFPTAKFEITAADSSNVTANLTIKGITKSVTAPYTLEQTENGIKASSKFTINRADWDVRFNSGSFFKDLGDDLIKDEISFDVNIVANK